MSKITAVILTKNSENQLVDCLESVNFCDEILVIDDNSTDRTVDIAKKMKTKTISIQSGLGFADKRNLALKKTKSTWILYIDSDERISSELKKSIITAISIGRTGFAAYRLKRQNFYLGANPWPHIETLERLFRKDSLRTWYGDLHETPRVEGKIGMLQGLLLHYTHRDLSSMVTKTIEWSGIEADLRYKAHHPLMRWWRFPRVMLTAFFNSYIRQKGYRAGTVGLIESTYQAFSMFITYARLWEMQQNKKMKN